MTHVICVCLCVPELEVARLSTEGNLADLTFPRSELHGNSIQLSASTLKQNGRNGTQQISHSSALAASPLWFSFLMITFTYHTSSMSMCLLLQVRSGWPLCCTETWAPTCPQRTRVWDWAARPSILITLSSSTPQSSWHQLIKRPIKFTCLSQWSSLSNTCRWEQVLLIKAINFSKNINVSLRQPQWREAWRHGGGISCEILFSHCKWGFVKLHLLFLSVGLQLMYWGTSN